VTDHHAIIPTGVAATGLTNMEQKVYDLVTRRFISVFYPDCLFTTTTVMGKVEEVEFKATGKQIQQPGWRVIYSKEAEAIADDTVAKKEEEEKVLPDFTEGESGPHQPTLTEKWTTPPKPYTEATLLRAMETAGKFVEDEELRAALKENGIGRPSSRAGIIETLFKRRYIRRERKNLIATETGMQLIDTIQEELLKSCELTGIWEKKLRDIEHLRYDAAQFIDELKQQITEIVQQVLTDPNYRNIPIQTVEDDNNSKKSGAAAKKPPKARKQSTPKSGDAATPPTKDPYVGTTCPLCGKGVLIKGKTAYGCSRWREGCGYRWKP
jgi:DNA topoisomerase-3